MKKKNRKKRIIIASVSVILVIGIIAGVLIARRFSRRAYVEPVEYLNMGLYSSGASYSGSVYESAQQNFFASADKKVEEVYVKEGDKVKKGDKLFRYDTTLLELDVEEKQLTVTICENALSTEQQRLEQYNSIVPYVEPATEAPEEVTEPEVAETVDASETPEVVEEPEDAAQEAEEIEEEPEEQHYTAQEKADKITEQELVVRKAQTALSSANQDLTEAQEALENATVVSQFDGTVTAVQDPSAYDATAAFCTVIGESGVTVKGYISELDRSSLHKGDKLYVSSYMTGSYTEAEVLTVNDYPADSRSYYGGGNPNASYYEFTAFMDDAESFSIGEDVELMKVETDTDSSLIVLDKIYVRTDEGGSYVLKDVDGVLQRQDVAIQKGSSSDSVIITGGLSNDDLIAFPYGSKAEIGILTTTEQGISLF